MSNDSNVATLATQRPFSPVATSRLQHTTPWGCSYTCDQIAPGIVLITTGSHGGIYLSPERADAMPEPYRSKVRFAGGTWFEEDYDWILVVLSFPEVFEERVVNEARTMWERYRKDRP